MQPFLMLTAQYLQSTTYNLPSIHSVMPPAWVVGVDVLSPQAKAWG
ncbi:MAG: hypothetical protein J1E82_06260 [Muribaculaceae bacterium]|nr:hypothetical protein [Muribaculaceae bacterium]